MNSKILKYKSFLDQYPNCPSEEYKEEDITLYRWVHEDISHENNFKPIRFLNPMRALDSNDIECISYGLSFFESHQTAKLKYSVIYNRYRNSKQKEDFKIEKGTHIAEIVIKEEDGICSNNKNGHFTFYEYNDTNLVNNINIINPIFALDETIEI
jgi:hypothetical protein